MAIPRPDAVVLGAGVIGLATALELAERGRRVALWTRDDPLATTSAVAGAIWYPFLAEPRDRVLHLAAATYRRLAALANDPATGVHMEPVVEVFAGEPDLWWRDAVPSVTRLPDDGVPSPFRTAVRLEVPVCDAPAHLAWLVAQLAARGVAIERRAVASFDEAFAVAGTVCNCTGLGAASLCGDDSVYPMRGQVLVCAPQATDAAWIDDTGERPVYAIPRRGALVVGGTATPESHTDVDEADTAAILAGIAGRLPGLSRRDVREIKVGLRPCRPTLRLEREDLPGGRRLVHDYGHGGSGFTLAFGCAEVAARLALD